MSHMPPTLAVIALDLVLIIPLWSDFDCFQVHHYGSYCFAFWALDHCYYHFDYYFSDPGWIPVIGFS